MFTGKSVVFCIFSISFKSIEYSLINISRLFTLIEYKPYEASSSLCWCVIIFLHPVTVHYIIHNLYKPFSCRVNAVGTFIHVRVYKVLHDKPILYYIMCKLIKLLLLVDIVLQTQVRFNNGENTRLRSRSRRLTDEWCTHSYFLKGEL